jgi:hypothetical protein
VNARREQRTYPGIVGGEIRISGNTLRASIDVRNNSGTPAYKFRQAIVHELCGSDKKDGFKERIQKDIQWDMVPGSLSTLRTEPENLAFEAIDDIINNRQIVIVSGRVDYEDTFHQPQYIEFRYRNATFRLIDIASYLCSEPEPIKFHST